jgi:hypothetical protein
MDALPFLIDQSELLTLTKNMMRDADSERWTSTEIISAINLGIQSWGRKVIIPHLYTISGGFLTNTFEYVLPSYIREPFDVQVKISVDQFYNGLPIVTNTGLSTWVDMVGWDTEPNSSGTTTLRVAFPPGALDGRIIWWGQNGRLPVTAPLLDVSITSSSTSLTLTTNPSIDNAGYIKIDQEWIGYAGKTVAATKTTLLNLTRGLNDTTPASHTNGVSIYFGIAVLRQDLFDQLSNQTIYRLHALFLTNASPQETEQHVFQARFYKQLADEFWHGYVTGHSPKMLLTQRGIGRMP